MTAGNASGVNDGAQALIIASAEAAERHGLTPIARVLGMATAGVPPRVMGIGPIPATRKLLARLGMKMSDFSVVELNEAFASQALVCLRELGLPDDAEHVNPQRRGDRVRPSARHVGGAPRRRHGARTSAHRRALRPRHDVRRRRPRRGDGAGAALAIGRDDTMTETIYPLESLSAHPPYLAPAYVSTAHALAAPAADHHAAHAVGTDRPGLRPRERYGDRRRPDQAACRRAARRAHHRQRPGDGRGRAADPQHADRDLAGQRRRPLHPRRRPAPGAARPELYGRGALRHRRRGPLSLHHRSSPAPTRGATTPMPGGRTTSTSRCSGRRS